MFILNLRIENFYWYKLDLDHNYDIIINNLHKKSIRLLGGIKKLANEV